MRLSSSSTSLQRNDVELRFGSPGDSLDLEGGRDSLLPTYTKRRARRSSSFASRMRRFLALNMTYTRLQRHAVWIAPLVLFATVAVIILRQPHLLPLSSSATVVLPVEPRASYPYSHLRNLIMVAGHSVYTSTHCDSVNSEDSWYLEPYQRLTGQAATFVEHIKVGVERAAQDPKGLLLFSGGQTRKKAGPRTEAQSYWGVAETSGWFEHPEVEERALTEEAARDSFENLLFSVCRFRELTGSYPENITVVSYDFKQRRFAELHRAALGFPGHRFLFVGTPTVPAGRKGAEAGEQETLQAFEKDPYGCQGMLHIKRLQRDPFARALPYPMGCPELQGLFLHCGPGFYQKSLPWGQK